MFTDIVGYTAMMRKDETEALRMLERNRAIQQPLIVGHRGKWLKEMGDGVLASFHSSTDALRCAMAIVEACRRDGIELRIGIHLGEVVFQGGDVFGDGVNIASRVESMAVPGSVVFTAKVYDDIRNKPDFRVIALGAHTFKNVDVPMELYALEGEGLRIPVPAETTQASADTKPPKRKMPRILWTALALISLCVIAAIMLWPRTTGQTSAEPNEAGDEVVTLAALPFSNIAQDEQIGYIGFALVDEVISGLSYLQNVVVRPSASVRRYTDQVIVPKDVGQELSVKYILTGQYVKRGDSIRLNLELMNIANNTVLWRTSVQERMDDIFELQDRVAKNVIEGLKIQFSGDERARMNKDVPADPLAYEYYLKALAYPTSVEGNRLAIAMLRKSVALDSTFAPAYSEMGLRHHYASNYTFLNNRLEEITEARTNLERALELNGELLSALGNLSLLETELNNMQEALQLARHVIEINPRNAKGHFVIGYVYRYTGLIPEAVQAMETAVNLDPNDMQFRSIIVTYNMAGQYEKALQLPVYEDESGFSNSWRAVTLIRMGRKKDAIPELEKAIAMDPESMLSRWSEGFLLFALDSIPTEEWMQQLSVNQEVRDPESLFFWCIPNLLHGDYDRFFVQFEKAVDRGFFPYPYFERDPLLNPVRGDPTFDRIIEKARQKFERFKKSYGPGGND